MGLCFQAVFFSTNACDVYSVLLYCCTYVREYMYTHCCCCGDLHRAHVGRLRKEGHCFIGDAVRLGGLLGRSGVNGVARED